MTRISGRLGCRLFKHALVYLWAGELVGCWWVKSKKKKMITYIYILMSEI